MNAGKAFVVRRLEYRETTTTHVLLKKHSEATENIHGFKSPWRPSISQTVSALKDLYSNAKAT